MARAYLGATSRPPSPTRHGDSRYGAQPARFVSHRDQRGVRVLGAHALEFEQIGNELRGPRDDEPVELGDSDVEVRRASAREVIRNASGAQPPGSRYLAA